MFVCYEALKAVKVREVTVETPLAEADGFRIDEDLIVVPILRAGIGMLEGILDLVPTARVGFVGMYRDKVTKKPVADRTSVVSGKSVSVSLDLGCCRNLTK